MNKKKVGIAGLGAIGGTVARALIEGIPGLAFAAASDIKPASEFKMPLVDFKTMARDCDLIVECLPAAAAPDLINAVLDYEKNMILISSATLLIYPDLLKRIRSSKSRVLVPSGAICGIDGVRALAQSGIKRASIASTKHPRGLSGAPYVIANKIDLDSIKEKTRIFAGNALEAARAFPANVNVAATLSLAGIGPEQTMVEVWADPAASGNRHDLVVEGSNSIVRASVENLPDPANPKTSMLAAQSVIAVLKGLFEPLVIL